LLEADETNTDERKSLMELGPKRRRKNPLHDCWLSAEVDEQPPLDRAFDNWNTHQAEPPALS
jgi:hypothetical protein